MPSFVSFIAVLLSISVAGGKVQREKSSEETFATLSVEKREICANKGDSMTISCTLVVHDKTSVNNWTLSWFAEDGEVTKNVTEIWKNSSHLTSYLKLDAVWSGEKSFTCVIASRFTHDDQQPAKAALNSTTVVKVKPRTSCDIIGFRYLEKPLASFSTFEVYWKPMKMLDTTAYTLNFCTEAAWFDFDLPTPYVCPVYYSINGSCSYRKKNVYNVPNTKGFTCMASVSTTSYSSLTRLLMEFVTSRAYIGCKGEGENCEHRCSKERKFILKRFHALFGQENDVTEVALIPARIEGLSASVAHQVALNWSDSLAIHYVKSREYAVRYKCSRDLTWSNTPYSMTKKLTLNRDDFQNYRPFDLCRFCVVARTMAQLYGGLESEPVCINVRLSEEPPSSPPNISCLDDLCQFTRDERVQNVSITWTLPPRRDWNGVLTELRISYLEKFQDNAANFSDSVIRVPIGNNSSSGETVLTGLSVGRTYWIEMVVCNKKGCSRPGKRLKISRLPGHPLITTESNEKRPYILAPCIAGVFVAAYLGYLAYTYATARRQLQPRLELTLCEQSGYDVIVENTKKNEYDVLVVLDSATRQMNVYTTTPVRCAET
ncbi:uncharacterized protein LOC114519927 [Dendronephthya gigantea]|uniref:uncharacterized protein LOC114519927 n=1 Tax=Dendronephthya gigantea TaxID=151771 RepID=UPI001069BA24|nr:uncharacterized protein LOC114519927 [Dendronephthya gigantea]